MKKVLEEIGKNLNNGLTLDGRKKVIEDKKKLESDYLIVKSDPEAFTKEIVINPVLNSLGLTVLTEKHFEGIKGDLRKVDYHIENPKKEKFLLEAKPLNSDLFVSSLSGAVNQIRGIFRLVEAKENYQFGIATNGFLWVFIDNNANIVYKLDLHANHKKLKNLLIGKSEVSSEKIREGISNRFYEWYNALLNGGKYRDDTGKQREISTKDCLVENITEIVDSKERDEYAQIILDRLIFIKFLQAKGLIEFDVFDYLGSLGEDSLNAKLRELFFDVISTEKEKRVSIDKKFNTIPYLNGSLFVVTEIEKKYPKSKIKASILHEIIIFLNSFGFIHEEENLGIEERGLDPEILGYIFEKAMTSEDRKGTGAYYTAKYITNYIAEKTIHQVILQKANNYLEKKGYPQDELLSDIEELFKLREKPLTTIYNDFIMNITICDNACGSGAFLLAAGHVLLDIHRRINKELRMGNFDFTLKRLIVKNNLFGVDINKNAIEIAKLRLWLWLVDAYTPNHVQPLPNIDYNLRVGNTLIGHIRIDQFRKKTISLDDFFGDSRKSIKLLIRERQKYITEYKESKGLKANELKQSIVESSKEIKKVLNKEYFKEFITKKHDLDLLETYLSERPFHWGLEFSEVFSEKSGFDIVIGNPPYFKVRKDNLLTYTPDYNEVKTAGVNSASLFLNKSKKLLTTGGYLGFIVPKQLFFAKAWEKIRSQIIHETTIFSAMDCGKAFKNVKLEQIIIIFSNLSSKSKNNIILGKLVNNIVTDTGEIRQNVCKRDDMVYLHFNKIIGQIKKKVDNNSVKLCDLADIKSGVGINHLQKKGVFKEEKDVNDLIVIKGWDIQRYYLRHWAYFDQTDSRIKKYSSRIVNPPQKKIVAQRIVAHIRDHIKITACIDEISSIAYDTVVQIIPHNIRDIYFLLGILNSKLVSYYLYKFVYNNAIRSMDFTPGYASLTPIYNNDSAIKEQIEEKVKILIKMSSEIKGDSEDLDSKNLEIENTENGLNQLIYDLYNLTPKERKFIEDSFQ